MIRTAPQTPPELPQAAVGGKRRFSLVWLIPIVAAIAGAWLVYTTFAERGPTDHHHLPVRIGPRAGQDADQVPGRPARPGRVRHAQRRSSACRRHRADGEGRRERIARGNPVLDRERPHHRRRRLRPRHAAVRRLHRHAAGRRQADAGLRGAGNPARLPGGRSRQAPDVAGGEAGLRLPRLAHLLPRHRGRRRARLSTRRERQGCQHLRVRARALRCVRPAGQPVLERQRHRCLADGRRRERPHRIVAGDPHGRHRLRHAGPRKRQPARRGQRRPSRCSPLTTRSSRLSTRSRCRSSSTSRDRSRASSRGRPSYWRA